jgi:hypothetical protein
LQQENVNGNLSQGSIVAFIALSVSVFGIVAFSVWWRATRREVVLPGLIRRHYNPDDTVSPQRRRQQHRGGGDNDGSDKKPVIFEALTGRQTMDVSMWKESVVSFRSLSCFFPVTRRTSIFGLL